MVFPPHVLGGYGVVWDSIGGPVARPVARNPGQTFPNPNAAPDYASLDPGYEGYGV
jgi:hypothetical protein